MIKINTYIVKPLSSKKENIFLILAFVVLILIAGIALKIRHRTDYKIDLQENEIISYEVLDNIELGLYSDIKNSLVDISQLRDEQNSLPSIDLLAEEEIPPYFKDITWEQRGAMEWTTFKHDGEDYLIGRGNGKVGTFLVKFNLISKKFFARLSNNVFIVFILVCISLLRDLIAFFSSVYSSFSIFDKLEFPFFSKNTMRELILLN